MTWRRTAGAIAVAGLLGGCGASSTTGISHPLTLAQDASNSGDWSKCISAYTAALAEQPDSVTVLRGRAVCEMQSGDPSGSIKDLDRAIQLSDSDPSLYLMRAQDYDALGNSTRSSADYRKVGSLHASSAGDLLAAMKGLHQLNLLDDAVALAATALGRYPKAWDIHDETANIHSALGNDTAAAAEFVKALDLAVGANRSRVYADRALWHLKNGNLPSGLADANQAIAGDANTWEYLQTRSLLRQASGDLAGADADLNQAISVDRKRFPTDDSTQARLYESLGELRILEGRKAEAAADFRAALNLVPAADEAHRRTLQAEIDSTR
jgi:hypothetical protein